MKYPICLLCFTMFVSSAHAQYYYKDLLVPAQAGVQVQLYKKQHIKVITLHSFESTGEATENFKGTVSVDQQFTRLITTLESPIGGASVLTSKFNEAGYLLSTADTTDGSGSTTTYLIKENGTPLKVTNRAISAGGRQELEEHNWMYKNNLPQSMLRIKNTTDTTFVRFVADEKGNVAEENSTRNGLIIPSYYYYYDENNRLTDIVSYNIKAKRLLPAYVFDYNEDGSLKSMMVVPEGSSDYQKWYYEYEQGLKVKETVFNKKKQLLGTIKYDYE